jgi:hypothetical protein
MSEPKPKYVEGKTTRHVGPDGDVLIMTEVLFTDPAEAEAHRKLVVRAFADLIIADMKRNGDWPK